MYNKTRDLLEQALLEFDPKKERGTTPTKTHSWKAAGNSVRAVKGEIERADKAHLRHKTNLPSLNKKVIKKAGDRALARGGHSRKGAGPKGSLNK